jgi:hypothetical protein
MLLFERSKPLRVAVLTLLCAASTSLGINVCQTACDCPAGQLCAGGNCLSGVVPVYCCDFGYCPPGNDPGLNQCQHVDGRMDFCGAGTATPTPTNTKTPMPTETLPATPTGTRKPTGTASPTQVPTRPPTPTASPTPMPRNTATPTPTVTPTPTRSCTGDCDGRNRVDLRELVVCLKVVNGNRPLVDCPACDRDGDGADLTDLVRALKNANDGGCR